MTLVLNLTKKKAPLVPLLAMAHATMKSTIFKAALMVAIAVVQDARNIPPR